MVISTPSQIWPKPWTFVNTFYRHDLILFLLFSFTCLETEGHLVKTWVVLLIFLKCSIDSSSEHTYSGSGSCWSLSSYPSGQFTSPSQRHTDTEEHTHSHSQDNLKTPVNPRSMFLDCGRKPTHAQGELAQEGPSWASNQDLEWGKSPNHPTTTKPFLVLPLCNRCTCNILSPFNAKLVSKRFNHVNVKNVLWSCKM